MDATAQTAVPLLSPDGHWRWDGAQWVPAVTQVPGWNAPVVAHPYAYAQRDRDGLAIASLICGIIGMGLGSVAAIILATKSRRRARQERREPSGVALAGLIIGWIGASLVLVGILAAIAIPVFLNQRHKAEAASVTTVLRQAATMEEQAALATGGYVPTDQLQAMGLRLAPQQSLAVVSYSATAYCLGARQGATTLYYSNAAGVSTAPC